MDTAAPLVLQSQPQSLSTAHVEPVTKTPGPDDTAADILVDRLIAWGVDTIFGVIGDGVNSVIEALRKKSDRIRLITTRHEQAAALMASGYAKYTGRLGACVATGAPGAANLVNGLYDAAHDGTPVIAITGGTYHDLVGTHFLQDFDAVKLMNDQAVFNVTVSGPQHASMVADLACRAALGRPGVAHLTIAQDTQQKKFSEDTPSMMRGSIVGSASWQPQLPVPPDDQIAKAAELLNGGHKIAILVGRGADGAGDEVEALAERLGAPVAKSLLGRNVIDDDSPYSTGGIGQLGTAPSEQMMKSCDTVLILGCTMPYYKFYPELGQARCVQVDMKPEHISLRYPAEIGLIGDVRGTLQKLLPLLQPKTDKSFLDEIQKAMGTWREALKRDLAKPSAQIRPQQAAAVIGQQIAADALIALDTGANTVFSARYIEMHKGQKIAVSGNLATMAPALPYAIAGQLAYPDRQSIAIAGDGGVTMLIGELATAARYKTPIKVFVLKNNTLELEVPEQKQIGSTPFGYDLQPIDFVQVAKGLGVTALGCDRPDQLEETVRAALSHDGPVLIEITVVAEEPVIKPAELLSQ